MLLALLQFVPLSLAAITPTMVIFVTALLAHDGNAKRALAVVIGRYLGLLIFGFTSLFVLHQIPETPTHGRLDQSEVLPVIFLVVGIALMLAAASTLIFGEVPSESNQRSLLDRFQRLNPPVLFVACLVTAFVSLRQLSLLIAGTAIIKETETELAFQLVLLLLLCLMMIWPLIVPLAVRYGMGDRGDEMLEQLRVWMSDHQRAINAAVLGFFGGILVAKSLTSFY